MNKLQYFYNRETCQYEPARLNVREVISYGMGLSVTALVFFIGIVLVHNYLVETDREKFLRSENKALAHNKPLLEKELTAIEASIFTLKTEDKKLYTSLFNTEEQTEKSVKKQTIAKHDILLAKASDFRALLGVLKEKSDKLVEHSSKTNSLFSQRIQLHKEDLPLLSSIPCIPPVVSGSHVKLVSGFGKRINPFHKGMYDHPGLDYAATRGTDIFATAGGEVITVKRSNLEAGYGNYIEIDHGRGFITRYAHLDEITVRDRQKVTKGMIIGKVGSSGGSTAPHVHYEIIRDGVQVNPAHYILEGLSTWEHSDLLSVSKKQNQSLD